MMVVVCYWNEGHLWSYDQKSNILKLLFTFLVFQNFYYHFVFSFVENKNSLKKKIIHRELNTFSFKA